MGVLEEEAASGTATAHALAYCQPGLLLPRVLPGWARALISLGDFAGRHDPCDGPIFIAVTVPVRDFAAVLFAAGFVVARNEFQPVHITDTEVHFAVLSQLPIGSPVTVIVGNTIRQGENLGVHDDADGIRRVHVRSRGTRFQLPAELSGRIQPSLGLNGDARPQKIVTTPMVEACLGADSARHFVSETRLDCVLVGAANSLIQELKAEEFAPARGGAQGALQEVVRAVEANPPGAPSRARVLSAFTREVPETGEVPALAVFDGARAFLGLRERFMASHRVAVVDRSREDAEAAAAAFNAEYARRADDALPSSMSALLADIAPSLEISAFRMRP